MKVSVVMPAYNAAGTIAEAIGSVLVQTWPNWELVVVDDGSRDETASIAQSIADRDTRIRVLRQANGGEAAARNTGIDATSNEWLLFLDADDWIAPTHLERLLGELASHPEIDAVYCGSVRVALDGTHVSDNYLLPAGDLFPTLARRAAFPVHACIVRKSLVERVGKFDTSFQKSADWDLWQRIARTGSLFGCVPDVLAYYRMAPHSSSMEAEQLLRDGLRVLKQGHSADARVPAPHPDYIEGLRQSTVESQEFYLLSWCAGLALGRGDDAGSLLKAVGHDRCSQLYPDAIARCVFEAATLPLGRPRQAWEEIWPQIQARAREFFEALEAQSQTPDLGRKALFELKKLVLRHSAAWSEVILSYEQDIDKEQCVTRELNESNAQLRELLERRISEQAALKSEFEKLCNLAEVSERRLSELNSLLEISRRETADGEQSRTALAQDLESLQRRCESLTEENTQLRSDLGHSRVLAEQRETVIVDLETQPWLRLGLRLGFIKLPEIGNSSRTPKPSGGRTDPRNEDSPWQLRLVGSNVADLVFLPEARGSIRLEIARVRSRKKWDIQINLPRLNVIAGRRYTLSFQARADKPRAIGAGFSMAHPPWTTLGLYMEIGLTQDWQKFEKEFAAIADDGNARIHFDAGGRCISLDIAAVTLRDEEGRLLTPEQLLPGLQERGGEGLFSVPVAAVGGPLG